MRFRFGYLRAKLNGQLDFVVSVEARTDMNAFKVMLDIAIAFVIGAGILTLINWKMAQTEYPHQISGRVSKLS
ncbi:MAG: hypothetical protein MJA27_00790 [Pseudanabaenales cyanobacterium]|nr:hypothetical protein [Pseudanabaenales cyanobacterium]